MLLKKWILVGLVSTAVVGCGLKKSDDDDQISGSVAADVDKDVLGDWQLDDKQDSTLYMNISSNGAAMFRLETKCDDKTESLEQGTSVEITKSTFKVLRAIDAKKDIHCDGEAMELHMAVTAINGTYKLANKNYLVVTQVAGSKTAKYSFKRKGTTGASSGSESGTGGSGESGATGGGNIAAGVSDKILGTWAVTIPSIGEFDNVTAKIKIEKQMLTVSATCTKGGSTIIATKGSNEFEVTSDKLKIKKDIEAIKDECSFGLKAMEFKYEVKENKLSIDSEGAVIEFTRQ